MGTGAFAGMFATILTHPIDVIRAKLTVQSQKNKLYQGIKFNYGPSNAVGNLHICLLFSTAALCCIAPHIPLFFIAPYHF